MSEEILIITDIDTKKKTFSAALVYDDEYPFPFGMGEDEKSKEQAIQQLKTNVQSFIKRLNDIDWDKSINRKQLAEINKKSEL